MNFKRKLWWAQHRTDVYKYGTILSLVLIVTISIIYFTYSKFTSKNEMTAYETTVEPFIKNDYFIASYIDGEWSNEIPGKNDGYVVDKIVCDNGATGTWDNEEWGINIRNATKKIKCSVFFIVKPVSVIEKITTLATTDTTNFATDDPNNNIRYIGANPSNYVYFNCSDYSNQSDSTCEKWRIIGVFKNITDSNNSKADLVKIIRDSTIGGYSYDSSDSNENNGLGYNDWASADLMKLLNGGYSSLSANNSLYYNASKGACYNSSNNTTTDCDFTTTGLKNDTTRNAFESVIWNIGGIPNDASSTATATKWYQYERGTTVFSSNHSTWTGQIAIMYPSDYGYATSGSILVDRNTCLDYEYTWNSDSYADCRLNNYLYKNLNQSSLGVSSSSNNYFYGIGFSGIARGAIAKNADSVRPTGYLKANTKVYDNVGDGSSNNPYRLILS